MPDIRHGVSGIATVHGVQLGYFPNGPHGHPSWGLYVDTLPKALLVAAVCLILFLLFNYVLVATARAHAAVARALLGARGRPAARGEGGAATVQARFGTAAPDAVPAHEGPAHGRGPGRG